MIRRILAGLLCLVTLLGCARAELPGPSGDVQAWLNMPPEMTTGAEWYVLALSHRGEYDFTACRAALRDALENTSAMAHTTRLKYALVLLAAGSGDPVISRTLAESAGQQGVMSHVYALHLMNSGVTAPGLSAEETVKTLLTLQYADGGWALRGAASDPDVTAMVLQCLAPHTGDEAVRAAVERGLDRLSALQRPEGDYASFGTPNPESTAQVIIALTELGVDPVTDARFIKDGVTLLDGIARYRLPEGGVSHTLGGPANANAATQVFLAESACELLRQGKPGLYRLTASVPAESARPETAESAPVSWRVIACGGAALAAAVALVCQLLRGKRRGKDLLPVLIIAGLAIALICSLDIQSADSYYTGKLPDKPDAIGTVTVSIRCDAALGHPGAKGLPADGVILPPTEMPIAPGDTVYTLLTEAAQAFGIHVESSGGPGMRYVQGIGNLYEFGLGDLSGWLYFVNGGSLSVGCDQCVPAPGDVIEWRYTLEMGGDLN